MSLHDQLLRSKLLAGKLFFCWPPPSCFLHVCLVAAVLKFFFPLTTSATSGTANTNKSAPTHFAAGMIYLFKKKWQFPQKLAPELQNHALFDVQYLCGEEVQE